MMTSVFRNAASRRNLPRRPAMTAALIGLAFANLGYAQLVGPDTAHDPYMLPSSLASGTRFISVISNGDSRLNANGGIINPNEVHPNLDTGANDYRLVGIPDGMGAIPNTDGSFTLFVNHELGASQGIVRAHGNRGAFVSEWTIRATPGLLPTTLSPTDFSVTGARDTERSVRLYNTVTGVFETFDSSRPMPRYVGSGTAATTGWDFNNPNFDGQGRHCSADLAPPTAYRWTDPATSTVYGTDARIYMNGEEIGPTGRAFAHIVTGPEDGVDYELPYLGDFSWENSITSPTSQLKTVVVGFDDSSTGGVYVYVGDKQTTGNDTERAGLQYGNLYGVAINGTSVSSGQPVENRRFVLGNSTDGRIESKPFNMYNFGDVSRKTGAELQSEGDLNQVVNFLRPEDGHWDPADPNTVWWLTTDSITTSTVSGGDSPVSRIWKMTFNDITMPEAGGTMSSVGESFADTYSGGFFSPTGATTMEMADNMTAAVGVDGVTRLLIQEDPGSAARLSRLWVYDTAADSLTEVGISNARYFESGALDFLTTNEETSGIIEADWLGKGWFILNMQAHYSISGELVEGGQVMAAFIPQMIPEPTGAAMLSIIVFALLATRRSCK